MHTMKVSIRIYFTICTHNVFKLNILLYSAQNKDDISVKFISQLPILTGFSNLLHDTCLKICVKLNGMGFVH